MNDRPQAQEHKYAGALVFIRARARARFALVGALLCACSLAMPEEASAQGAPGMGGVELARAKHAAELADEGAAKFAAGEFGQAAALFLRAHAVYPEAAYLYNASIAYKRAGNLESATSLLKRAAAQPQLKLPEALAERVPELLRQLEQMSEERSLERFSLSWVGYSGSGVALLGASLLAWSLVGTVDVARDLERLGAQRDQASYDALRAQLEARQRRGRRLAVSSSAVLLAGAGALGVDLLTRGSVPWEHARRRGNSPRARVSVLPGGVLFTFTMTFGGLP